MCDSFTQASIMRFADYLKLKGTDLYIVPGTHHIKFLDSLDEESINKVKVFRTEQGAGYGAIATSTLRDTPASLMVIAGPGIANTMSVIAHAYNNRVPLIVYGVNNWASTLSIRTGTIHELGYTYQMFNSVTLKSVSIKSAEEFCGIIDVLYEEANKYRLPIYIELPSDILDSVSQNSYDYPEYSSPQYEESNDLAERCAQLINNAHKPVLFCGYGTMSSIVNQKVIQLSRLLNLPIITNLEACSFFHNTDTHIGPVWDRIFVNGNTDTGIDAVLGIGCDLGLVDTGFGKLDLSNCISITTKKICHFKYDDRVYECNMEAILDSLLAMSSNKTIKPKSLCHIEELKKVRAFQEEQFFSNFSCSKTVRAIQAAFPEDTVFCSDVFLEGYLFEHFWDTSKKQKLIYTQTFSNLGSSLGMTVGSLLSNFNTVCLAGDGGISFCLSELATALKYNKKIQLIVFNNNMFGTVEKSSGTNKDFYSLVNPEFNFIARAYGLSYYKTDGSDISSIISEAVQHTKGYIIEVNFKDNTPLFNQIKWN